MKIWPRKFPADDICAPEMFMGNWAVHYFMHGIFIRENVWTEFSFSCIEMSFSSFDFSCIKMKLSCMKLFVGVWGPVTHPQLRNPCLYAVYALFPLTVRYRKSGNCESIHGLDVTR